MPDSRVCSGISVKSDKPRFFFLHKHIHNKPIGAIWTSDKNSTSPIPCLHVSRYHKRSVVNEISPVWRLKVWRLLRFLYTLSVPCVMFETCLLRMQSVTSWYSVFELICQTQFLARQLWSLFCPTTPSCACIWTNSWGFARICIHSPYCYAVRNHRLS